MYHTQARLDERVEPLRFQGCIEFGKHPLHQPEVDGADDVAVLFGGLAERAVVQQDLSFSPGPHRFGSETDVIECLHELPGRRGGVDTSEWRWAVGEEVPPSVTGLQRRLARLLGLAGEVTGEDLGQQAVAASPGAGGVRAGGVEAAGSTGQLAILAMASRQARLNEPVEMKTGGVGMQPHPLCDLADAERCASPL